MFKLRNDWYAYLVSVMENPDESLAVELEAMSRELSSKKYAEQSEVFTNAMKFINSMETSPSCHRLATATLLRSCKSIRPPDDRNEEDLSTIERLNRVKSIFAARLAVCELTDANAIIPSQCNSLQPRENFAGSWVRKRFTTGENGHKAYEELAEDYYDEPNLGVSSCLNALESRPQWWTSYSNARQNAVIMCEATRSEIEKGKLRSSSL